MDERQTFRITIEMGNDAMQTPDDVSRALCAVADELAETGDFPRHAQNIRDINGNRVGTWKLYGELVV